MRFDELSIGQFFSDTDGDISIRAQDHYMGYGQFNAMYTTGERTGQMHYMGRYDEVTLVEKTKIGDKER